MFRIQNFDDVTDFFNHTKFILKFFLDLIDVNYSKIDNDYLKKKGRI